MALPFTFVRLIFFSLFLVIASLEDSEVVYAQTMRLTEETDKEALFVFKSGVSEASRVVLESWNDSVPLCRWTGVKCGNKHKRVTRLDLGGLKLTGVVSPFVGNLSFLRSLNLGENFFHGVIPQEFGNLFRLQYLNMSNNFLEGVIPVVLSNCSSLSKLDLTSNHLEQGVPSEFGSLSKLVRLSLSKNNLTGKFPSSLGNLTSLRILDFVYNQIEGEIPGSIARLKQMVVFQISANKFTGVFPPPIYNMTSLRVLSITSNSFSGTLRPDFGSLFPNLKRLIMGDNSFRGTIPDTISNISTLLALDMPSNQFTGNIPLSFGKLQNLLLLGLGNNSLGNYSSGDLDFLGALTNCTQLKHLNVYSNKLGGQLPVSIANLSTQLIELSLDYNFISGSIPHGVKNLVSLQTLSLSRNLLIGKIPPTFGELVGLRGVDLDDNRLSGEIPASMGNISLFLYIYLANNSFEGSIPSSLGNCSYLLELKLSNNKLNGSIPHQLMELPSLLFFNISLNFLVGPLREDVGNLKNLVALDVSYNKLSGQIPHALANCRSLEYLGLQGNSFFGNIPDIRGLTGLISLDLSKNNLSGTIPEYMTNFSNLLNLNLSFNNFQGAVPTEGIFRNASAFSVYGSINLCGGIPSLQLKPCSVESPGKHSSHKKIIIICVIAGIVTPLLLYLSVVYLCRYKKKSTVRAQANNNGNDSFYEKISYDEIYKTTDGFSSSNLIGSGNFGDVFKGFIGDDNKAVAIKVLNLRKHGAAKSFMAECEALKGVRHRNLVKLVTVCSSADYKGNDFRALVYEFLPNGNLDTWLHPNEVEEIRRPSRTLTLLERLNIGIDVASVLDYLHVQCHDPIAHCDLKPSNVLLDDDLTAHVSDFGLAHLLLKFDQDSFLNQLSSAGVRGTIGYVAPEYGMGGHPSIHGDVYSFGVLLLEMFTGKRPTSELFGGNFTLYSYAKSALPEHVLDIADESILHSGLRVGFPIVECLKVVFEIGLRCCEESPTNRTAMCEVVKELISMRERFFKTRRTPRR